MEKFTIREVHIAVLGKDWVVICVTDLLDIRSRIVAEDNCASKALGREALSPVCTYEGKRSSAMQLTCKLDYLLELSDARGF